MVDGKISRIEETPSFVRQDALDSLAASAPVTVHWQAVFEIERRRATTGRGSSSGRGAAGRGGAGASPWVSYGARSTVTAGSAAARGAAALSARWRLRLRPSASQSVGSWRTPGSCARLPRGGQLWAVMTRCGVERAEPRVPLALVIREPTIDRSMISEVEETPLEHHLITSGYCLRERRHIENQRIERLGGGASAGWRSSRLVS